MTEQQAVVDVTPYGPDIIGEAAFRAQQEVVEKGIDVYGPDVIDDHPLNARKSSAPKPAFDQADLLRATGSIEKLDEFLFRNPTGFDAALELEFQREKPRRGALDLFLRLERMNPVGTRQDIVDILQAKINAE